MKKSINIGIILFLLLQACSSSENTENQATVEPISEDTPINQPVDPNNPQIIPMPKTTESKTSQPIIHTKASYDCIKKAL